MNTKINRAFLETLAAYLAETTSVESDQLFKTKMEEMDGSSVRSNLESVFARWQSLTKERRISLTGVEEISERSRLSATDLEAAIASTKPLPPIAFGIRSRSSASDLNLVPEHIGPFLPSRTSVMDKKLDSGEGILPGTVVAKYRVDWAGVYCIKETPVDQGSPHDEIYVIFTTLQPFRKPWTQRSNIEGVGQRR